MTTDAIHVGACSAGEVPGACSNRRRDLSLEGCSADHMCWFSSGNCAAGSNGGIELRCAEPRDAAYVRDDSCGMTLAPTPAPTTPNPTPHPTAVPTTLPTAAPTTLPTSSPTALPTAAPTTLPTAAPTTLPTASPTALPTAAPTALPGLQIRGSKFQSTNSNSRELELTSLSGLVLGCIEAKFCK